MTDAGPEHSDNRPSDSRASGGSEERTPPPRANAGSDISAPVEVAPGVIVPAAALRFTYTGSRGPGGQNVNRRATRAELRVTVDDLGLTERVRARLEKLAGSRLTDAGELMIGCDEKRSQRQNRDICMQRLRELVVRARALPKPRKPTRPSRGAVERRIREKKQRGEIKKRRKPPEGGQ